MKNKYCSDSVDLLLNKYISEKEAYDHVPTLIYDIFLHNTNTIIGNVDLRLLMNEYMYFYGHIGYFINNEYRGHNYAFEACKLIKTIAKDEYDMKELIITCNPDNIASYKTLEKLGCLYCGIEDVPKNHVLYLKGEKKKAIFKLNL